MTVSVLHVDEQHRDMQVPVGVCTARAFPTHTHHAAPVPVLVRARLTALPAAN